MLDDEGGVLIQYHPLSYAVLSLLFALPFLYGLLQTWPDVTTLPSMFPGRWGTVVLFSTLISSGMAVRTMTPSTDLGEPWDDRAD